MIRQYLARFVFALVMSIMFLASTVILPVHIQGSSMEPTCKSGETGLAMYTHDHKRFDVVIIDTGNRMIVKRIIALPGETLEYKENILYIDGQPIKDALVTDTEDIPAIKLGQDEYYCMGDNRDKSADSRIYGPFKSGQVVARLLIATDKTIANLFP